MRYLENNLRYYSFKIFPKFWLAKSTRIIHGHNQLLMTKFVRILCLTRKWSLLLIYKSCPVTNKSCQRESKINYYSWFFSLGTSRLIQREKRIALTEKKNNNLITARKPLRPLSNVEFLMTAEHSVDESN